MYMQSERLESFVQKHDELTSFKANDHVLHLVAERPQLLQIVRVSLIQLADKTEWCLSKDRHGFRSGFFWQIRVIPQPVGIEDDKLALTAVPLDYSLQGFDELGLLESIPGLVKNHDVEVTL